MDCIRTVSEHIIEILSLSDRPIILVCRYQGLLHKSDGFTPNGARGAENKGVAIFDQYAAISRNGNSWRHIYYGRRIKSYVFSIKCCRCMVESFIKIE